MQAAAIFLLTDLNLCMQTKVVHLSIEEIHLRIRKLTNVIWISQHALSQIAH